MQYKRRVLQAAVLAVLLCLTGVQSADAESTYVSTECVYDPADYMDEEGNILMTGSEVYPAEDGYTGYWTVLSEDTWMYTFYVYDEDQTYYVYEDEIEGFAGDASILNPIVLADGTTAAVITNTADDSPQTGSLLIEKQVTYADGTVYDSEDSFTVSVTLTAADGSALSGTMLYGDYAFSDGETMVTITDDEPVLITEIPEGCLYEVTEIRSGSYQVSYENRTGTILADAEDGSAETETVVITNQSAQDPPDGEEMVTMDVTLAKEVTGYENAADNAYEFYVRLSDLTPGETYALVYLESGTEFDGSETAEENLPEFTARNTGEAIVHVFLEAGQSVTLQGIPEGASYTASEQAGAWTASYEITDTNGLGLILCDSGENTGLNQSLSTQTETADTGGDGETEEVTIIFTNELAGETGAVSLADTGGEGVLIPLAASLLTAAALFIFQERKRKHVQKSER